MTADEREHERRRLRSQVRDLAATERDDSPAPEAMRRAIEAADRDRRAAGRAPLRERPDPPEVELYARARALGLRRLGR